jgi:hypothetical protein
MRTSLGLALILITLPLRQAAAAAPAVRDARLALEHGDAAIRSQLRRESPGVVQRLFQPKAAKLRATGAMQHALHDQRNLLEQVAGDLGEHHEVSVSVHALLDRSSSLADRTKFQMLRSGSGELVQRLKQQEKLPTRAELRAALTVLEGVTAPGKGTLDAARRGTKTAVGLLGTHPSVRLLNGWLSGNTASEDAAALRGRAAAASALIKQELGE